MITFDIIIFISSIVFGIALYWLEAKNNGLYRSVNKITNSKELRMPLTSKKGFFVNQESATDLSVALMARDFMSAARSGDVQVKEEQQRDDSANNDKDIAKDDIPF